MSSLASRAVPALVAGALFTFAAPAVAAPPQPSGPHPRLWLNAATRASIKELAKLPANSVSRSVAECRRVGGALKQEARNLYMGLDWAAHASTCAIAYHATGEPSHAATSLHFFNALLDDWDTVGDGKGGDTAARHDSGYAIRALGVHTAIVYDLLHDAPGMTPAMLAKARTRFKAWTDWYAGNGYRMKSPGTNYHAGYLFAVTLIAIAQGSEAGADGAKLWTHLVDQMWGREMKGAAVPGAVLDGGDWGEGWQYGPLAVSGYSLAARAMIEQGIQLPEFSHWAEQVVLRQIYSLSPNEKGIFVGGDTQVETAAIPPNPWTLASMVAGPSPDRAAGWARAEIDRLHLASEPKTFLVFEALADARKVTPVPFPRDTAPTFYLSKGTGTFFARSTWSPAAAWMAMQCTKTIDVDHLPSNAGNFVLTRGGDEMVVDPSPYGSLASTTSNAPTVESGQLPADYKPSQAFWSEKTGYAWARQTESAIVAARCDYADQYKFQQRPSDVPMAMRDVVLVPGHDGNATVVVVDQAKTGAAARGLHLRFRTKAGLALGADGAHGTVGRSQLKIVPVFKSSGTASVRQVAAGNCFGKDSTRGNCSAARFPVQDYVLTVNGEDASAVHVLDMAGANEAVSAPRMSTAPDHRVISFDRGARRTAVVLAAPGERTKLTYRAAPGHHVVLDAPGARTGRASVVATQDGPLCVVTITPAASGGYDARPLVLAVSDTCSVRDDATQLRPALASIDGPAPLQGSLGAAASAAASGAGSGAVSGGAAGPSTPSAGSSSDLPASFFTPPPDAQQLPAPPGVPKTSGSRGGCVCVAAPASPAASGAGIGLAVAAAGLALLAVRRRRS